MKKGENISTTGSEVTDAVTRDAVPADSNMAGSLTAPGDGATGEKTSVRRTMLLEGAKVLAAVAVGGGLALAAPVRSLVFDRLWTKAPRLGFAPLSTTVHVDDDIVVTVVVEPQFPGVVPTGVLTFIPPSGLEPLTALTFPVVGSDQVKIYPEGSARVAFRAIQPGAHTLNVQFRSQGREKASADASLKVDVGPNTARRYPTLYYLAGYWRLILGGDVFPMSLTEPKARTISGIAEIRGSTWRVYGSHDGGTVQLHIENPSEDTTRYFLSGELTKQEKFVKAKGKVVVQVRENNMWVDKIDTKAWQSFEADSPTGP